MFHRHFYPRVMEVLIKLKLKRCSLYGTMTCLVPSVDENFCLLLNYYLFNGRRIFSLSQYFSQPVISSLDTHFFSFLFLFLTRITWFIFLYENTSFYIIKQFPYYMYVFYIFYFKYFNSILIFKCMSAYCMYVCTPNGCLMPPEAEEGVKSAGARATDSCELTYGGCESNSGPLVELVRALKR